MMTALAALISALTLASHIPIAPGDYEIGPCRGPETSCTAWDYGLDPVTHFETLAEAKRSFYHEAGHQFRATHPEIVAPFVALDGRKWTRLSEERFAETFALCAHYGPLEWTVTGLWGFRFQPWQQERACAMIRRTS